MTAPSGLKWRGLPAQFADYSIVTSDNSRSEDPQAIIDEIIVGFTKKNYETCVDRKEAIGRALKLAQKDQIVLIAGKGHEDYQIFKDRTIAFNEREIVKGMFTIAEIIEATKGNWCRGLPSPCAFCLH